MFISVSLHLSGYARVVLAVISFYFMPTNPVVAGTFYILSGFLDAFDGWAARKFNQGTMFGAVLDMVTDRSASHSPRACVILQYSLTTVSWSVHPLRSTCELIGRCCVNSTVYTSPL